MLNGSQDTKQAASQKLLEAVVHLRRANDALMAIMPLFTDLRDKQRTRETKKLLVQEADHFEEMYHTIAQEAFSG